MTNKVFPLLKVVVLISTVLLGLIAIFYVLELFSGEYLRALIVKIMAIIGIFTGVSLVVILLTDQSQGK